MSIKGVFKAECPACHERFDADFWTVVRGDHDLALKEALISGEFDLLMCPSCSNVFPCEETFIYMDPEKELLIFVMPESYLKEKEKWLEKMRLDYDALRESFVKEGVFVFEPQYYFGAAALASAAADPALNCASAQTAWTRLGARFSYATHAERRR